MLDNECRARRLMQLTIVIAGCLALLAGRLAWLQLAAGGTARTVGSLAQQALREHSDALVLDSGRGVFRDRKGRLLTGADVQSLAAFPDNGLPRGSETSVRLLANALGVDAAKLDNWLNGLREPAVWRSGGSAPAVDLTDGQLTAVRKAALKGVAVLPYRNRYPAGISPLHAVGYVSQHPDEVRRVNNGPIPQARRLSASAAIGGAGLEKSLDRLLQGVAPTAVLQMTDASRQPLGPSSLRLVAPSNPHFPLQVATTLDLDIQNAVEKAMKAHGVAQGAVVVLDAANADILAMLSLPAFDPYRIGAPGTDSRNHALAAAPPGSIFKTVTLAAALEAGATTLHEKFHCDGHYGKYGLRCWKPGGHGELTVAEAYAHSCNVVFAALAERMDPAWLQITGERLGFGRQIGWSTGEFVDGRPLRLLPEEESGAIFPDRRRAADGGVRAGTGIGQRDVRVTPLQAANMAVTLLHDGRTLSPRIVKEVRYADGNVLTKLQPHVLKSPYGRIRPHTAAALRASMRAVVGRGTAAAALRNTRWPLAGKSGTAELAGALTGRNDHWFVGYGPALGKPRYAVAVLIEHQAAGLRNRAAAVFGDIMDDLADPT